MTAMDAEKSSVDEYRSILFLKDFKSFSINFLDSYLCQKPFKAIQPTASTYSGGHNNWTAIN
jgi:hypothetical protein